MMLTAGLLATLLSLNGSWEFRFEEGKSIAGLAYWQFFDTRTSWRDCGPNGKKPRAMSAAGLFDAQRRPKIGVRTVTDGFRNRTPANLEDCK